MVCSAPLANTGSACGILQSVHFASGDCISEGFIDLLRLRQQESNVTQFKFMNELFINFFVTSLKKTDEELVMS